MGIDEELAPLHTTASAGAASSSTLLARALHARKWHPYTHLLVLPASLRCCLPGTSRSEMAPIHTSASAGAASFSALLAGQFTLGGGTHTHICICWCCQLLCAACRANSRSEMAPIHTSASAGAASFSALLAGALHARRWHPYTHLHLLVLPASLRCLPGALHARKWHPYTHLHLLVLPASLRCLPANSRSEMAPIHTSASAGAASFSALLAGALHARRWHPYTHLHLLVLPASLRCLPGHFTLGNGTHTHICICWCCQLLCAACRAVDTARVPGPGEDIHLQTGLQFLCFTAQHFSLN